MLFFSLSPINLTPTPPHSSFVPALARQFLNGTRRASIVLLTHSEDGGDFSAESEAPQSRLNHQWGWVSMGRWGHWWRTHYCSVREPLFFLQRQLYFRVCKKQDDDLKFFFFVQDRITKGREGEKKAICFWLLSLASLEPGWAWASKCQSDKDQAWQTYTGVLSFHVSSLLLASPIFASLKSPDKGCRDERHVV